MRSAAGMKETAAVSIQKDGEILYAQEIPDGYQLVDSTPRVKLKLYRTSIPVCLLRLSMKRINGCCIQEGQENGIWNINLGNN